MIDTSEQPRPQPPRQPQTGVVAVTPPTAEPEAPPKTPPPLPRRRPDVAAVTAPAAEPVDPPSPPAESITSVAALAPPSPPLFPPEPVPLPPIKAPPPAAQSTCGAMLARLGVESNALAPVSEGRCGIGEPVAIASLGDGATRLTTKAIAECTLAETFATWMDEDVQPLAKKIFDGEVTGLRVAASYTCRTRNGVKGAKLSEHGRGKAIDISAFKVEGQGWIEVGGRHSFDEGRFLNKVRMSACGPFTTVLGPGSDAHHSDHFHFDLATRNKGGRSRGLYCR